jgi:hypothetical protein
VPSSTSARAATAWPGRCSSPTSASSAAATSAAWRTQLGALGLGLNAIVYWNSLYIDAAVKKLAAGGMQISPEIRAHLSPLQWEHINFHGTYPFNRPELPGRLRDLRHPSADDDQEQ